MSVKFRVALVGDYKPSVTAHHAIPEALRLAVTDGRAVEGVWVATESICDPADDLAGYDGFWCVPASPYANMVLWEPFVTHVNQGTHFSERAQDFNTQ